MWEHTSISNNYFEDQNVSLQCKIRFRFIHINIINANVIFIFKYNKMMWHRDQRKPF